MQGIEFDRTPEVWRKMLSGSNSYQDTKVYKSIPCAIVPISDFGSIEPYARESTHVIYVPYWIVLRKEDQIRDGRQPPYAQGGIKPNVYTIQGRSDFRLGIPQLIYYAKELD